MQAEAVPLQRVLNSDLQMIVPIFQREYTWGREPVRILWEDITKLYKSVYDDFQESTHFMGPIVRVERNTFEDADTRKFWIIDGQQRIITLMILLSCIRNEIKQVDEYVYRKIESGYLMNYEENGEERYKLIPSEGDKEEFIKIIDGEEFPTSGKLKDTFDFFTKKLKQSNDIQLEKLRTLIIKRLVLVNIDVDKNENPYLIFESLNGKGTPLTQADLIRNYIFMKIGDETNQRELYNKYWRKMEQSLGKELQKFFWTYSLKEGTFVQINRTYANLKNELERSSKNAENELKTLYKYSIFYKKLIEPNEEENTELKERFSRHNQWEIGTEYPFLLNIYKDYSEGKISSDDFCEMLDIIESLVIRRFFCKYPTNKLRYLFMRLYKNIDLSDPIETLKTEIENAFPKDYEFIEGLKTFPIYKSGQQKTSLLLWTLEKFYGHKEHISPKNLQIEHIMPQASGLSENLPNSWKKMLGSDYERIFSTYLHTLGNLTLTGYNPELAQKSFSEKKKIYEESHLELNKYFKDLDKWDEEEITKRTDLIIKNSLNIWKNIKEDVIIDNYM